MRALLACVQGLMGTLVLSALLILLLASGQLEDLASYLELLPLPQQSAESSANSTSVSSELLSLMAADFGLCFAIEKSVSHSFRY